MTTLFGSPMPSIPEDEDMMLTLASFSQDIPHELKKLEGNINQDLLGNLVPPLFLDNTSSHIPLDNCALPSTSQTQNKDISNYQILQNLFDNENA